MGEFNDDVAYAEDYVEVEEDYDGPCDDAE